MNYFGIKKTLLEKRKNAIQRKYEKYANDPEYREQYRQKMLTGPMKIHKTRREVLENLELTNPMINKTFGYDETLHNSYKPPAPDQFHDSSFDRTDPLEVI